MSVTANSTDQLPGPWQKLTRRARSAVEWVERHKGTATAWLATMGTIVGLAQGIWSLRGELVEARERERNHREVIHRLDQQNRALGALLEALRQGKSLPDILRDVDRFERQTGAVQWSIDTAQLSQGHIVISGAVPEGVTPGHQWIGIYSGVLLWPLYYIGNDVPADLAVRARITIPDGVQSGDVVLVTADEEANKLFENSRSMLPGGYGHFLPHLRGVTTYVLVKFSRPVA